MKKQVIRFSASSTDFYFDSSIAGLKSLLDPKQAVIITDEHVFDAHKTKFRNWNTIVLKPGEEFKVQQTADAVIDQLVAFEADRKTMLVGVGGGVITDLTGYVASVYMRGIPFGFVPTTVLSMVDASIGGKNGVDVGVYKNMVGTIRQPGFILHDYNLLSTLPHEEWVNGFAEIIKHACIKDAAMFRQLEENSIEVYRKKKPLLAELVRKNALLKIRIVQKDEFEQGDRKLLNFGHTLGHALENQYELSHGQAISIGMTCAAEISERLAGFSKKESVVALLERYGLPTYAAFNPGKVFGVLRMDKKRMNNEIGYVLLEKIGKGIVRPISIDQLQQIISALQ